MMPTIKVPVIEAERGWGSRVDDYMGCVDLCIARNFIIEFNANNNKEVVPDWYMKASDEYLLHFVTKTQYDYLMIHNKEWLSILKNQ